MCLGRGWSDGWPLQDLRAPIIMADMYSWNEVVLTTTVSVGYSLCMTGVFLTTWVRMRRRSSCSPYPKCWKCQYTLALGNELTCPECGANLLKPWCFRWNWRYVRNVVIGIAIIYASIPLYDMIGWMRQCPAFWHLYRTHAEVFYDVGPWYYDDNDIRPSCFWVVPNNKWLPEWYIRIATRVVAVDWSQDMPDEDDVKSIAALPTVVQVTVDDFFGKQQRKLSDISLTTIASCKHIHSLSIDAPYYDRMSAKAIIDGDCLDILYFNGPGFNDDAAKEIGKSKHLQVVRLFRTRMTDEGMVYLSGIPTLKELFVVNSHVSPEGAQEFRRRRPDVALVSNP